MLIYAITSLILTPIIVIAFEISHLYAPTIDSSEDMNINSNSEFTTITDDLIYLETKPSTIIESQYNKSSEMMTPDNQETIKFNENTKFISNLPKISSSVNIITTNEKIIDHSDEIEKSKLDDSLIIATNYDKSQLSINPINSDCSSGENNSNNNNNNKENENIDNIYFNHINRPNIDLNDFITLIPVDEVQGIVREYYKNDKEVKRAYAYLESQDFIELKMKILNIQEVNQFLRYLNHSGLNIVDFINKLVKLCGDPEIITNKKKFENSKINDSKMETIENSEEITNSTTNGMSGLHGLVDSILDVLPQDQIISVFFEKLETDTEFSKFIQNIGSDMFSYLLKRLEESIQLRNLVYTLHNNGIYIARIVDSLKDYFFLGL